MPSAVPRDLFVFVLAAFTGALVAGVAGFAFGGVLGIPLRAEILRWASPSRLASSASTAWRAQSSPLLISGLTLLTSALMPPNWWSP